MKTITKLFILIDILIIFCFVLVYGPFDKARVFWITTSMETMNHKYLAHIFYSQKTIDNIMDQNYLIATQDTTDTTKITIGQIETKNEYENIYEKQILEREKDQLYKLIKFKYKEFNCYLVAIYDPTRVEVATSQNIAEGQTLTTIAKNNNAIVAINGGGYSWSHWYPRGLIVRNGKTIYAESSAKYVTAAINNDGVLMAGSFSTSDVKGKNIKQALSFGPALITNGKPVTIIGTGGSGLNPRTVIAQRKDGIILFLVVDGYGQTMSWKGRGGVYLNDLLVILQRYGAYNAINMDGGSSTTMVINGKLINSPCDPQQEGQDFIRSAWILK